MGILRKELEARPLSEWHEDMGDVLWWAFPITEAPYVGTPNDLGFTVEVETAIRTFRLEHEPAVTRVNVGGWPGYHTHWTPIVAPLVCTDIEAKKRGAAAEEGTQ